MNVSQPALDFDAVSEPIAGETAATVELVGSDWRAEEDWRRFEAACEFVQTDAFGVVDPNAVRAHLSNKFGLTIEPRRYSAFWSRASRGKDAFLVADGWVTNTDAKGRNQGKPLRRYKLRDRG